MEFLEKLAYFKYNSEGVIIDLPKDQGLEKKAYWNYLLPILGTLAAGTGGGLYNRLKSTNLKRDMDINRAIRNIGVGSGDQGLRITGMGPIEQQLNKPDNAWSTFKSIFMPGAYQADLYNKENLYRRLEEKQKSAEQEQYALQNIKDRNPDVFNGLSPDAQIAKAKAMLYTQKQEQADLPFLDKILGKGNTQKLFETGLKKWENSKSGLDSLADAATNIFGMKYGFPPKNTNQDAVQNTASQTTPTVEANRTIQTTPTVEANATTQTTPTVEANGIQGSVDFNLGDDPKFSMKQGKNTLNPNNLKNVPLGETVQKVNNNENTVKPRAFPKRMFNGGYPVGRLRSVYNNKNNAVSINNHNVPTPIVKNKDNEVNINNHNVPTPIFKNKGNKSKQNSKLDFSQYNGNNVDYR
jgi:hypothetical protein